MKAYGAVLVALAILLALGTLTLWTPLSTDQAIFTYGGRTIAEGGTLYVDFWDVKPPGIFFFYALGGALFAFDEAGLHLFELLWLGTAAAILTWLALRRVEVPLTAALAPVASIGVYLAYAGPDHRTQVEALMVLPITLSLAAAAQLARRPEAMRWAFLLGLAGGLLALFKPVYLPFPLGFALLATFVVARREGRRVVGRLPRATVLGLIGFAAVWLPVIVYFGLQDAADDFLWTTFQYPRVAVVEGYQAPLSRLSASLGWFLGLVWTWLPLAAIGLLPARPGRDTIPRSGAILYLLIGAALIWVQTISWWAYHFSLLLPPVGLLASLGLDRLLAATRRHGRPLPALAAVLLLALPVWMLARQSARVGAQVAAAATLETDAPLAVRLDGRYRKFWSGTRELREGGRPGTIYVFGDIRILLLSERLQAIPVHGHGWALFPDVFWQRLPAELMAAAPTYVYITPYNRDVLAARVPELVEFFDDGYAPIRKIAEGTLLARKP